MMNKTEMMMSSKIRYTIYILLCLVLSTTTAFAQLSPERSKIRKGNRDYNDSEYERSIERYNEALEADPTSFAAQYNLANALYKAERMESAEEVAQKVVLDTLQSDDIRAMAHYNLGNIQFKQQKLNEALESYKNSLRLNPADTMAKYNYAYTKRLLDDQNQDGGGGEDDQNKDQNQDEQQGDQNKEEQGQNDQQDKGDKEDKGEQNQEQGDKDNEGDKGDKEQQGEAQTQPVGISEQEQEQILNAIQAQEDKTQDKLKEQQGVVVKGGKNW